MNALKLNRSYFFIEKPSKHSKKASVLFRILFYVLGKQEFRRTDFGSRLLATEGEGGGGEDRCG